jgi:hypothetical protein
MLAKIGVFAAPARSATRPIAGKVELSSPNSFSNRAPDVAPIKNMGVTMPPLPPKFRVIVCKNNFQDKCIPDNLSSFKDFLYYFNTQS